VNQPNPLHKLPLAKVSKLNNAIALRSNQIFATMGFFWFCLIFALIPLKWPATMAFVQYASSGVLQLIALPLLGVGTILAARASDQLGKEQHDAVMETVKDMQILMAELHQLHLELAVKVDAALKPEDGQNYEL
jgi:Na+-driven multidrug efflux pump